MFKTKRDRLIGIIGAIIGILAILATGILFPEDANALTQIQPGCYERSNFTYCNP